MKDEQQSTRVTLGGAGETRKERKQREREMRGGVTDETGEEMKDERKGERVKDGKTGRMSAMMMRETKAESREGKERC